MLNDLTEGKPSKQLLLFSLPLLLSTALQQVYNIADSMIVGRLTGAHGLAAIGAGYPVTLFYVAVATGASMGCSVVIAQLFGAKDTVKMKTAISTAVLSLTVLGLALSLLGVVLAGGIMRLIHAGDAIFSDSTLYLRIYAIGVFPMILYNAVNAIFTGLGDSRRPLYFLALSSLLNIALDYLTVGPLQMGVAGAAWATVVSQIVAALLSGGVILRKLRKIPTSDKPPRFDRNVLKEMTRIGLPAIFQQASVAVANTVIQSLINTFDTAVVAGFEVGNRIITLVYSCMNTIGTALSNYIAQCFGAGKYGKIREGVRFSFLMCLTVTLGIVAVIQIFPAGLTGLFLEGEVEPQVMETGVRFLRIVSPVQIMVTVIIIAGGLLRGLGDSLLFFVETLTEFAVKITMSYILVRVLRSYTGILWAWYFGSSVGCLLCVFLWRRTMRRLDRSENLDWH